jgi:beta-glucanase (GH16 family)
MLHIGIDRQSDGSFAAGGMASYPGVGGDGFGFGFQYGKVEILAKASEAANGTGMTFLLWPSSNDHWPPEVDILETPQGQGLGTNHWQGPNGNGDNQQETFPFAVDITQWHTYGLEWTPDHMTWLVDGTAVGTTTAHIPNELMSLDLMGYVGSATQTWFGGAPAASVMHVGIDIDSVKIFDYLL